MTNGHELQQIMHNFYFGYSAVRQIHNFICTIIIFKGICHHTQCKFTKDSWRQLIDRLSIWLISPCWLNCATAAGSWVDTATGVAPTAGILISASCGVAICDWLFIWKMIILCKYRKNNYLKLPTYISRCFKFINRRCERLQFVGS